MKSFLNGLKKGLLFLIPAAALIFGLIFIKQNIFDKSTSIPADTTEESMLPKEEPSIAVTENSSLESNPTDEENISEIASDAVPLNDPVIISFAGDMLFTEYPISRYEQNGIVSMVSEELLTHMTGSDLFMANEEFPFSTKGEAMQDKQFTFRVDPKYTNIFHELGVDIVTVANNHGLDFGTEAFLENLDTLDAAGISRVGGGRNTEEARAAVIKEVNGYRIGFLGASRVIPVASWTAGKNHPGMLTTYDPAILLASITELRKDCDYVFVYVHWGIEKDTMPQQYQRDLARAYIDAGADAVIGAHPHVMQGFEFYKGKPIAYSLGNFLFSNSANKTVLYKLTINPDGSVIPSILPCVRNDGQMQVMTDKNSYYTYLEDLSFDAIIDEAGIISPTSSE